MQPNEGSWIDMTAKQVNNTHEAYYSYKPVLRIRDVYPGSWFLSIPNPESRILDLGSRIQQQHQKMRGKKIVCPTIFCSHKYHKIVNNFIFWIIVLLPKNLSFLCSEICVWVRDPRSRKNRYSGSRVKKAPEPGSATLEQTSEHKHNVHEQC